MKKKVSNLEEILEGEEKKKSKIKLDKKKLRKAILYKEILDLPLSKRR